MKKKNVLIIFILAAIICAGFTTCQNPIMSRWWDDVALSNDEPIPARAFYIVNFNMDGGHVEDGTRDGGMVPAQLVAHDALLGKVSVVTRDHHAFAGWFRNAFRSGEAWDFTTPVKSDMTLFAGWIPVPYTVTFETNGGTPQPDPQTLIHGTPAEEPPPMSLAGQGFQGWWILDSANNWDIQWNFAMPVERDMTLYARWSTSFVTVNFNSDNGTPPAATPQRVASGGRVIEPPAMDRPGFAFAGWYDFDTNQTWDFTRTVTGTGTINLIARWVQVLDPVSVTFITNSPLTDTWVPAAQALLRNNTAQEPAPINRPLHFFNGWWTRNGDPVFGTAGDWGFEWDFAVDQVDPPGSEMFLYARWVSTGLTVTFNANGGNPAPPSQRVASGARVQEPLPISLTGHGFDGWWTRLGTEWVAQWDFTTMTVNTNMTLHARWDPNQHTVEFQANGGSPLPITQRVADGSTVTRPAPMIRVGHYFGGWFRDPGFTIPWDFTTPVTSDMTLHAKWEPNQHTVTFERNGGLPIPDPITQRVLYRATVKSPAPMTRTGFAFGGWFANPGFTGSPWNFATGEVLEDLVLYAKWEASPDIFTVIFNADGGTPAPANQRVPDGARVVEPVPMAKANHGFAGWYVGNATGSNWSEQWIFDMVVDSRPDRTGRNIIDGQIFLYAKWETNYITVVFEAAGGMPAPANQQIVLGSLIKEPLAMQRPNNGFAGWFQAGARTPWNFNSDRVTAAMVDSNNLMRLQAVWNTTTLPPTEIVRQVRIHGVYYIDFAGNQIIFNNPNPGAGAATGLTTNQIAANWAVIEEVWNTMNISPDFFLQLSGHANPTRPGDPTELEELRQISNARADAVINVFRGQYTGSMPFAPKPPVSSGQMVNTGYNPRLYGDRDHPSLNRCVEIIIIEILPP